MAENTILSSEELQNLKEKYEQLTTTFQKDNKEFLLFKSEPITYLRNSGIVVMKYIDNKYSPVIVKKLHLTIKNILRSTHVFNRCAWCKIFVLLIIYSTICKSEMIFDVGIEALSSIMESVKEIFNTDNEFIKRITYYLKRINSRLSHFVLARLICEHLGYCP